MNALTARFEGLAAMPHVPLIEAPTPVEPLAALGAARGLELWIKRDERVSALYGGNKPRKLEYVLGDAVRRGARVLVTFGGLGTHHGLATCVFGRAAGLRTVLVLVPQPVTEEVRRTLRLAHAFGAELHWARGVPGVAATTIGVLARTVLRGERPFVVEPGGSSVAGTIGFVRAGLELAEQIRAGVLPEPHAIYVPLGTGGTVAGLALGLAFAGIRSEVVGVLVTDILPPARRRLHRLARRVLRRLHALDAAVPVQALDGIAIRIVEGFTGAGYGAATPEGEAARRLMGDTEGVTLESTYTAKCLAAMLAEGVPGRRLLFWNTFSAIEPSPPDGELPPAEVLPPSFRGFFAIGSAGAAP